ncbi:MAG: bifunctional DNA-formamidopyrimidine glycosylase/DNA-(apurinic or apyrimidinic site) lyase [Coxiellaceae bacterium]|jgi:formamidopyrimidine-DNA glycosylase|nr:bifunctional DNA-formamidopyrimidine glycosylase/DNA-(apurinic or apyrimidinic site) lyase [Coxiellaceae bacterium]
MPELPEIETICRDLNIKFLKQEIITVNVRISELRYPIPKNIHSILLGQAIKKISRRGKYILLKTRIGVLIIHLGMSGTLQIKMKNHLITKHEHFSIEFSNKLTLCYSDPRRFGAILWTTNDPLRHALLKNLGLEPLTEKFTAEYLYAKSKIKKYSIKLLITDNKIVVGIGNIYANEILYTSGINPFQKAYTISLCDYKKIVKIIKEILNQAISHRGTTIKDYTDCFGQHGSFQNKLKIYNRSGRFCYKCKNKLITTRIRQRLTVFCPKCQQLKLSF